jgi:FkbM family methyltransferase
LDLHLAFTKEFEEVGLLVDVGAHVGSFAEAFAKRGWDVIAVEAAPEIYAALVDRLAPSERVDVVQAAAGDTGGGEVEFFISSASATVGRSASSSGCA